MKQDTSLTNMDCLKLIQANDKAYFETLIEFLRGFDDDYCQALLSEFLALEFNYIKN